MENEQTPVTNTQSTPTQSDNKKWIIIGIVVVLIIIAARTLFSPERAVERAMEHAIEQASDGAYRVDIDARGNSSVMEITGENGESVSINAGGGASLPDNWPADITIPSDANISYSAVAGEGMNIVYETDMNVADTAAFYKDMFSENGWTIEVQMATGEGSMLSASQGETRAVTVFIGAGDNGKTTVNLSSSTR